MTNIFLQTATTTTKKSSKDEILKNTEFLRYMAYNYIIPIKKKF